MNLLASRSAVYAALILAIGMGFGRFCFTGIFPVMANEGSLTLDGGAYVASANYAGYLLGALLAINTHPNDSFKLCLYSILGTALTIAFLAVSQNVWFLIVMRGLSGAFSATAMVGASSWLLQYKGDNRASPILYAGIGFGILISAELIAISQHFGFGSAKLWFLLGGAGLLIGIPCILLMKMDSVGKTVDQIDTGIHSAEVFDKWKLVLIYGLAGFGYIITATYLPLIIKDDLGIGIGIHIWAVFGLGAMFSCFFWHGVQAKLGSRNSLFINLIIQSIGVALPVFSQTLSSYLCSALLVGGTFMGFVTIAKSIALQISHEARGNFMAIMTTSFGIGQIAGPLVANETYDVGKSFSLSLLMASMALIIAAVISVKANRKI